MHEKCPYSEFFWSVSLGIQSECRKIQTRKTPDTDTFHAVSIIMKLSFDCGYCIRNRFEQTEIYAMRHELMLKAAKKEPYDSEFDEVINFYGDDFVEVTLRS